MAILINRETKLITCGYTGHQGSFHSQQSRDYGTELVGGVTPGKGGTMHEGLPVFNTVAEAIDKTDANAAMIFVPPKYAADSIIECIEAHVPLVVCITDGIPTKDMIKVKSYLDRSQTTLLGPNSPGVITPGECKIGIMPGHIHMPGNIGVVSRSGTLSYDIVYQLTQNELGQSTCVGVGADPISGTDFVEILSRFEKDPDTDIILMIGEIGGISEVTAARWIRNNMTKPVVAFVAGTSSPKGRRMGHAGAIITGEIETAESKIEVLADCGVHTATSIEEIVEIIKKLNYKEE